MALYGFGQVDEPLGFLVGIHPALQSPQTDDAVRDEAPKSDRE
jgi:hypothetical protein